MKLFRKATLLMCVLVSLTLLSIAKADPYIAWDELAEDPNANWIEFFDYAEKIRMYPTNATDTDVEPNYIVAFSQAGTGDKAKGMNALKFVHGGQIEGHLVSTDLVGSFDVKNTGNDNDFSMILITVAINTDLLAYDFEMTIGMRDQTPYQLGPDDFGYSDNPLGRPSGYYSVTDPNGEPLTYAFNNGMVTVYGVSGLTGLASNESVTIDYSFSDLPGPAVFNVYGFMGVDIYHTNKAFLDQNDIGGSKNKISTFAVTVQGDVNKDLKVDFLDFAVFANNWLIGVQ